MIAKVPGRGGAGGLSRGSDSAGRFATNGVSRGTIDKALLEAERAAPKVNNATKNIVAETAPITTGSSTAAIAGVGAVAGAGAIAASTIAPESEAVDRGLETAENVINKAGMVAWLAPGGINLLGGGAKKIGGWTNANWLQRSGTAMQDGIGKFNNLEFGQLSEKAGIGGWFSKIMQPVANVAGTVSDKVAGVLGLKSWRSGAHLGKAAVAHSKAAEIAMEMEKNIGHAPEQMRGHLETMLTAAKVSHPSQIDTKAVTTAQAGIKEFTEGGVKLEGALAKQAEKLKKHLGNTIFHTEQSLAWKNAGTTVKNLPKTISGAKVAHVAMNGAFVAGSAVSMVRDQRSFSHDIASLKQMAKDITGEDYSTTRLLFGSVPKPIADVRWKVAGKLLAMETADAGNIAIQLSRRVGPLGSILSMMGVVGLSGVANTALSAEIIGVYTEFSDAYRKGKALSAEDYAKFLMASVQDLAERGEKDPAAQAGIQALAEKYAAERLAPAEMLKRASGTQLMADLNALIKANEAKAPQEVSQVAKLQGAPQAAMPVKGEHSAKIVAQAQGAAEQGRVV